MLGVVASRVIVPLEVSEMVAASPPIGALAPLAPPEVVDQFAVFCQSPLLPTQYRSAANVADPHAATTAADSTTAFRCVRKEETRLPVSFFGFCISLARVCRQGTA